MTGSWWRLLAPVVFAACASKSLPTKSEASTADERITPEVIDTSEIVDLQAIADQLTSQPTQENVNRAVSVLAYGMNAPGAAAVETALRALFEKNRPIVLTALATAPGLAFDSDLAAAVMEASPSTDNTALLKACAVSGGRLTRDLLLERATIPEPDWSKARIQFWKAALPLDLVATAESLLIFYGMAPAGRYELEREPEVVELVTSTIELVRQQRDEALRLIPSLGNFLGVGAGRINTPAPPPLLPCAGQRLRVLTASADLLSELNSPASLMLLVRLQNVNAADCPELAQRAAALDLRVLSSESWLIPRLFLDVEIPNDNWTLASTRALGHQAIGLPRDLIMLDEATADTLNRWERYAAKKHFLVPQQPFSVTQQDVAKAEARFINAAWSSLKRRFKLEGETTTAAASVLPIPGTAHRYFSFRRARDVLTRATTAALVAAGVRDTPSNNAFQPSSAHAQAEILVMSELERCALVLLAIYAHTRRVPLNEPFEVAGADELLDRLSNTSTLSVATSSGRTIVPDPTETMPAVDCVAPMLRVTDRVLDLDVGLYEESLVLSCPDGKEYPTKWIGPIPFPLQGPLRRHPRLLDFLEYSLAWRELRLLETPWSLHPTDIDYVRQNPELSINLLSSALIHPEIPAVHVRDALVIGSDFGRNPLVPMVLAQRWQPRVPLVPRSLTTTPVPAGIPAPAQMLLEAGLPGGIGAFVGPHIAPTPQAFEGEKKRLKAPFDIMLTARANGIAAEKIRAAAAAIPDECQVSNGIPDPFCLLGIISKRPPKIKKDIFQNTELARRVGEKMGADQYFSAWDLAPILSEAMEHVYLRDMVISPNLDAFGAVYELRFRSAGPRFTYAEGPLSLPTWAKVLLHAKPNVLNINDVDVSNVALHADDRFAVVAARMFRIQSSADVLWHLLDQQSMASLQEAVAELPVDTYLESSADGLSISRQQSWALQVRNFALGESLPVADTPRPEFVEAVKRNWQRAVAQVREAVEKAAAPNLANIKAYQDAKNQFVIYFQIGWGNDGVWTGGAVSMNGIGVGLSSSFNNSVHVSVVVSGQPITIANVNLPQTGPQAEYLARQYDSQLAFSVRSGDTQVHAAKSASNIMTEAMNADPLLMGKSIRGADKTTPEFKRRVIEVARHLVISPQHLMAVMSFESGQTFSPGVLNSVGSGATGLIQFMPPVAVCLGTTVEELAKMTAVQQMEYVQKYFEQYKDKLATDHTLRDVYMAVLYPAAIGKGEDYVLFRASSIQYQQNRSLDLDGNGSITAGEAATAVDRMFIRPRLSRPLIFKTPPSAPP
jgi:hypothetical protein